jgi:hypothetical protein
LFVKRERWSVYLLHVWCPREKPYRVCQWLPRAEKRFAVRYGQEVYVFNWRRWHESVTLRAVYLVSDPLNPLVTQWVRERKIAVKKREKFDAKGAPPAPADKTSTILGKLSQLRAWCSETTYDDGTKREPGAVRITSRHTLWQVTVTDPDACARLVVSDPSLDKALLQLELLLGTDTAPWELDVWKAEQEQRKKKK